MNDSASAASMVNASIPAVAMPSPSSGMDMAAFESAWQAVSLEPAAWAHSSGPSALADLANQQQNLLSNAFDMSGMQLQGKSAMEVTFEMARKQIEMFHAKTTLDMSWAGVKEVRKGIETVMNSK
jgi:hypothetical protein